MEIGFEEAVILLALLFGFIVVMFFYVFIRIAESIEDDEKVFEEFETW